MNPRFTIVIIVGAFLLGLGTVFGFALGRRTAFFASRFPQAESELLPQGLFQQESVVGSVVSMSNDALEIRTDEGKLITVELLREGTIEALRPFTPEEFAASLELYRAELGRDDVLHPAPPDSAIEPSNRSALTPGTRVQVIDAGKESQKIFVLL